MLNQDIKELSTEEKATNAETWKHIDQVMRLLGSAQIELMRRQFKHDRSKLGFPEVSTFTEYTPKLRESTYGSEEYKGFLRDMAPALKHHYANNRHHPEFFSELPYSEAVIKKQLAAISDREFFKYAMKTKFDPDDLVGCQSVDNSIDDKVTELTSDVIKMNLFDILEMLIDWVAACKRHADGDPYKSIAINKQRFGINDQLNQIMLNTVNWIEDEFD